MKAGNDPLPLVSTTFPRKIPAKHVTNNCKYWSEMYQTARKSCINYNISNFNINLEQYLMSNKIVNIIPIGIEFIYYIKS